MKIIHFSDNSYYLQMMILVHMSTIFKIISFHNKPQNNYIQTS